MYDYEKILTIAILCNGTISINQLDNTTSPDRTTTSPYHAPTLPYHPTTSSDHPTTLPDHPTTLSERPTTSSDHAHNLSRLFYTCSKTSQYISRSQHRM